MKPPFSQHGKKLKYYGDWSSREDIAKGFNRGGWETQDAFKIAKDFPLDSQILVAVYCGADDYAGRAFVLFRRGGKLFEVNASHCSCDGLSDQWTPEKTTWRALAMRPWDRFGETAEARIKLLIKRALRKR